MSKSGTWASMITKTHPIVRANRSRPLAEAFASVVVSTAEAKGKLVVSSPGIYEWMCDTFANNFGMSRRVRKLWAGINQFAPRALHGNRASCAKTHQQCWAWFTFGNLRSTGVVESRSSSLIDPKFAVGVPGCIGTTKARIRTTRAHPKVRLSAEELLRKRSRRSMLLFQPHHRT